MIAGKKKVSWNDLNSGTQSELKNTYNLTPRQLEQEVRKHLDGASATERRNVYQSLYSRKDR